jgi:N-methylhydantoinase A
MHGIELASELGIRKLVIPFAADVFSAWGMLMSDLRRDYFVTHLLEFSPARAAALDALLREVTARALEQFVQEGVPAEAVTFRPFGKLRYENQEHSVEVPLGDGPIDAATIEQIAERFHGLYEREYTYRLDAPIEFVGVHVVAVAEVGKLEPAPLPVTGSTVEEARKSRRTVDFATAGIHETDVYAGELLEPGMRFTGPAIVETKGMTIVVTPGSEVTVDTYGNVVVEIAADEAEEKDG